LTWKTRYALALEARGRVDGRTLVCDFTKGTSFGTPNGIMLYVNGRFIGLVNLDKTVNQFYEVVCHNVTIDEYGEWLNIYLEVPND
jgi:hypothetical protein